MKTIVALIRREHDAPILPDREGRVDRIGRSYSRRTGRCFVAGSGGPMVGEEFVTFTPGETEDLPVYVGEFRRNGRHGWAFRGAVYSTTERLNPEEVRALIAQDERKLRAKVAAAMASEAIAGEAPRARGPIPDDIKVFVWQRDQGRCVRCGSNLNLEFDHIIPVVMGGANTARNLQLLCEPCNRQKGGNLV